ncbi:MAG TPA: T9SS C-terminal target domain-containing protein, partial [Bacteroidia bacterium]|nr:T9SS C-terminal target domain-containing protein [Bacteroidia bacterium]
MKRKLLFSFLCFLIVAWNGTAQTLEDFEDEPLNQQFFTSNGQVFNITTQAGGTFKIYQVAPSGTGWNGTSADDKYIDNFQTKANNTPIGVTISSAGSKPFVIKSMYCYLSNYLDDLTATGTLTIIGKLGGVTKFTGTKSTGFTTQLTTNNGFTYIDMTTFGGSD